MENCEQKDVCEKVFDGIDEKFKVVNNRIKDLENKSEEINSIDKTLAKMEVLYALQRDDSVKRDKSIEDMNKTQIEITNTLKTLTESINKTDKSVDNLDKKVDKNNEDLTKKIEEITKDNTISIPQTVKYIFITILGTGIGLGIAQLWQAFVK